MADMTEMKTLTMDGTTYEVVDEQARTDNEQLSGSTVKKTGDTMTGVLNMPGGSSIYTTSSDGWPTLEYKDAEGYTVGAVQVSTADRMVFMQRLSGATYGERYSLPVPTPDRTSEAWYRLFTAKYNAPTYNIAGLMELGITTFPTTMSEIASKMTANSMFMVDSRDIISGGTYEISDLGQTLNGTYIFFKGNSAARVNMLHIYGTASATTSWLSAGVYAVDTNTVTWNKVMPQVLNDYFYGDTLPEAGTPGRIFFKLAE